MYILPLVFSLLIILSILTIEKMDKFKNSYLVQKKYEQVITQQEKLEFNKRQLKLFGNNPISYRQITFRPFLFKKIRDDSPERYKQYRQITVELIRIIYGNAAFYKEIEQRRPDFVNELLDAIQISADQMHKDGIKRIQDVMRIKLNEQDLQEVFYRMLKGTIEKNELKSTNDPHIANHKKTYMSLLTFINFDGIDNKIKLGLAPKELLLAIYGKEDLVNKLIEMRIELSKNLANQKIDQKEATEKFKTEFEGKQKEGISADLLEFTITITPKEGRE